MTQVAQLTADLTANTSRFEAGLKKADKALNNSANVWGKALDKSASSFDAVGKKVTGLVAGYLALDTAIKAATGIYALTKGAVDHAAALKDTSDRLQISIKRLQEYQYAAKLSGMSNDELETAFIKLNAQIADGKLKYANTNEAIYSIADAVKNARTATEKLAIVNDAFGNKMGAKLLPLLSDGVDGLKAFAAEAQRTGNVIDTDTILAADKLGDQFDALASTIKNNFTAGLLDEFINSSGAVRDIYSDPQFAQNIRNVGEVVGDMAANIVAAANALGKFIGAYDEMSKRNQARINSVLPSDESLSKFDAFMTRLTGRPRKQKPVGTKTGAVPYGPSRELFDDSQLPDIPTYVSTDANKSAEDSAKKAAEKIKDVLSGLKQESDTLNTQVSMWGQKESAINKATKAQEIMNRLAADGITLSAEQQNQVNAYLDAIEKSTNVLERQKLVQEALKDVGDSVKSAFEDAVIEGKNLSDVLDGLFKDIEKILLRMTVYKPIEDALGSLDLGGIFSGIFGGGSGASDLPSNWDGAWTLPSFASGTPNVPRDMVAKIHKGEEIVPASQVGKDSGYGDVIINNNKSDAQVTARKTNDGKNLEIMVDELVAQKLATPGTKTNQSLRAQQNRGLKRR